MLWAVAFAGVVGFVGNEAVAVFRLRVGREIESAALIADGYHARTDGLTSLAVVLGAMGVWLGYRLADPIVGLIITLAIFGIVWQSAKAVFSRLLDGVEPGVVEEITHAAEHVAAVKKVKNVRARWLGHRLTTELDVVVAEGTTVVEAEAIATEVEEVVAVHVPALASAHVRVRSATAGTVKADSHAGHQAPEPFSFKGKFMEGTVQIVDTPDGERMTLIASCLPKALEASVVISRPEAEEVLTLLPIKGKPGVLISATAPAEPHEFDAKLVLRMDEDKEVLPFSMTEPEGHVH